MSVRDDDERVARFTLLFERHYDAVVGYARRRADPSAAADVAADAFLVAWRRIDDVPGNALPWLLVTARRILANRRRGDDRAVSLRVRLEGQRVTSNDPTEAFVDDLTTHRRWASAFGRLDHVDQEVLALTAWDGLTAAQAATVLGCGASAYVMRLHRARRRLRNLLASPSTVISSSRRLSRQPEPNGPES